MAYSNYGVRVKELAGRRLPIGASAVGATQGAERPRRPPTNIGARPRLVKRRPGTVRLTV